MKKLIAVMAVLFSVNGFAFIGDGNDLYDEAQDFNDDVPTFSTGIFMGKVAAVADSHMKSWNEFAVCYPANAKLGQLSSITAKWLEENPDQLHKNATYLIWTSHVEAFGVQAESDCWLHDAWAEQNR